MKKIILLNIGNTSTEIACFCDGKIQDLERVKTKSIREITANSNIINHFSNVECLGACVVPSLMKNTDYLNTLPRITWLNVEMISDLDFSDVDKTTIGADRLANAVAAVHSFSVPIIILDCGTAITTEVIDTQKRFLGGVILPGRNVQRRSLKLETGQLPMIDINEKRPTAIGQTTTEAIRSGVDLGLLGAVKFILYETQKQLKTDNVTTIAVGGDSGYFVKNLSNIQLGPKNFTLTGLAVIAKRLFSC